MTMHDLRTEIQVALNKHSAENGSNTPDFILADYLESCLSAFDRATQARTEWYGEPQALAGDRSELGNPNKPSAERCVAVDAYGLGRCVLDAHASGSHAWEEVQGPPGPPQRWQVSTAEGGA